MELTVILLALALAFIAESMSEYLFGWIFDLLAAKWPVCAKIEPMKYVAALVGVALALAYNVDVIAWALKVQPSPAWVGVLLTGLAIGRGANYLHDFAVRYLGVRFDPT